MEGALIILAVTVAVGLLLFWQDRRSRRRAAKAPAPSPGEAPKKEEKACCGLHIVCEKDFPILPGEKPLYYDDEELDRYAGRAEDAYTDEEIEEFRDIMLTMRPEETAGWARSLQQRGIAVPAPLRDELLLLIRSSR